MVLIEILLKKSTSGLFLKLVASVLPRHTFTYHPNVVMMIDITLLYVWNAYSSQVTSIDNTFETIYHVYDRLLIFRNVYKSTSETFHKLVNIYKRFIWIINFSIKNTILHSITSWWFRMNKTLELPLISYSWIIFKIRFLNIEKKGKTNEFF